MSCASFPAHWCNNMAKAFSHLRLLWLTFGTICLWMSLITGTQAKASSHTPTLPSGFSYLQDIDATILQDMRYATTNNFTGKVLPGYQAGECILRSEVARALSQAQAKLLTKGYSLKVYDCYRPARAVRAFGIWARNIKDLSTKDYYPRLPKSGLFGKGYIARRSTHSIGYTVDLTLVRLPARTQPIYDPRRPRKPCTNTMQQSDNSLDMGTRFDCFDIKSHTANRSISKQAHTNRTLLKTALHRAGFASYRREWWHFSYTKRRYKRIYHNFPIQPFRPQDK